MKTYLLLALVSLSLLVWSCEEEFIPPVGDAVNELVVEGYIEAGDEPAPAIVFLTRSFPFFSRLSAEQLANAYVRGARVTVSDGSKIVQLTEICLDDLPPNLQDQVTAWLGFDPDSLAFNICAYVDIANELPAQTGKTYSLRIEAEGKTLTASTTIPERAIIDSVYFTPPPGMPNDTLAQCLVSMQDPPGIPNFYRYFTATNGGPLRPPFGSVTDDRLFDGQSFTFPLPKAESPTADFDFETFGLYRRGDEVVIKFANIDEDHYNFWTTLEFNAANQGPFSTYTRVDHNIQGGIGIWGGLNVRYIRTIVPEN